MSSLNTSSNGVSISASYQKIVNTPLPTGPAANSPTYGQWAVFSVQAPLANAFQPDPSKESVLKVQSTGEGELIDLIEDLSDGKIQFAFLKVKDTNSGLPKNVLVCWCGEGVPERTKGYFNSHMSVVSKLLHGYHVQITARSDQDLTPEGIVRKVADSSGSKYSGGSGDAPAPSVGPRPPVASKPSMPTKSFGTTGNYSMGGRSRAPPPAAKVDADGWGEDAPQVSRSQLEKVGSAYQPTKVNMAALQSGHDASRSTGPNAAPSDPNVVRGGYQPIGKVDIAAIRAQARDVKDDRPTTVKGAYEPIGKVDIADIRRKAQASNNAPSHPSPPSAPAAEEEERPKSLADRSAAFTTSERLTTLPKPKVANRFGADTSSFAGTKAPAPGGFDSKPISTAAPIGVAGRTFADSAGKTPAQQWAEKKARERGNSGAAQTQIPVTTGPGAAASPIQSQQSGGWQSSYSGKKWGVQIPSKTGGSGISEQKTGQDEPQVPQQQQPEDDDTPSGGIGNIRDRFNNAPPMGAAREVPSAPEPSAPQPPPLDNASKPNAGASRGVPIPGMSMPPPPAQPEPEEEEEDAAPPPPSRPQFEGHPTQEHVNLPPPPPRPVPVDEQSDDDDVPQGSGSPIAIARPVARGPSPEPLEKADTRSPPPALPTEALAQAVAQTHISEPEPQVEEEDPARGAGQAAAAASFGATEDPRAGADNSGGHEAIAQYDYEKAEENELELREGERVFNIDMVDEDWWMGENSRGEKGLFPSNYVELVEASSGGAAPPPAPAAVPAPVQETAAPPPPASAAAAAPGGKTATAQYDYEAAEDNELSFPDGGKITGIVSFFTHPAIRCLLLLTFNPRNSPTTTGGSVTLAASRACSLPTTSSSTRWGKKMVGMDLQKR